MSSIGTGYDLSASQFSPDGRVFQVEYAQKAVENSGTAIGLRCKDGIVFAVEKIITSKLYESSSNKRIFTVDTHIGMTCAGLLADARAVAELASIEASNYRSEYSMPIPCKGYWGTAIGKAKQNAKTEIEKLKLQDMTCRELIKEAAKIIYLVHDEVKDKNFALEMSWVCKESEGRHKLIPKDLFEEAERYAKATLEESSSDEDEEM